MSTTTPVSVGMNLPQGAYTTVYTVPSTESHATLNVSALLQDLRTSAIVGLWICPNGFTTPNTPPDPSTMRWPGSGLNLVLGPSGISIGVAEDTGIVVPQNAAIVMYSSIAGVTAHVHGFTKSEV